MRRACACATCHVYIDPSWLAKLEPREEMEEAMLEIAWESARQQPSQCQIQITAEMDGLEVTVPDHRGRSRHEVPVHGGRIGGYSRRAISPWCRLAGRV